MVFTLSKSVKVKVFTLTVCTLVYIYRATSNVLGALSHEMRRFERGEGGGVT